MKYLFLGKLRIVVSLAVAVVGTGVTYKIIKHKKNIEIIRSKDHALKVRNIQDDHPALLDKTSPAVIMAKPFAAHNPHGKKAIQTNASEELICEGYVEPSEIFDNNSKKRRHEIVSSNISNQRFEGAEDPLEDERVDPEDSDKQDDLNDDEIDNSVGKLSIMTKRLPNPVLGEQYDSHLAAAGGAKPYRWSIWSGRLPEGIFLHPDGFLYGKAQKLEVREVDIRVRDDLGAFAVSNFAVIVIEDDVGREPEDEDGISLEIIETPLADAAVGVNYYHMFRRKGGTAPFTWMISSGSLDEGLRLESASGVIFGAPIEGGELFFTVNVTDSNGMEASRECRLRVISSSLYITSGSPDEGMTGDFYTHNFRAQGGKLPYRWQMLSGTLPHGLSFDSEEGIVSGYPGMPCEESIVVKVIDDELASDTAQFTIIINTEPLTIITDNVKQGMIGERYIFRFEAIGGIYGYQWNVEDSGLPSGLGLDSQTGIIHGIPDMSYDGNIQVIVVDSAETEVRKVFGLVIQANDISIKEPYAYYFSTGDEVSQNMFEEGGSPPYVWFYEGGDLPKGVIFDDINHCFFGRVKESGEYTSVIRVTDSNGKHAREEITFIVSSVPLTIPFQNIPQAHLNIGYEYKFQVQGGVYPYMWSIISGHLPEGMFISEDGYLYGAPDQGGAFDLVIQVQDEEYDTAERPFSLKVNMPIVTIIDHTFENGSVGQFYDTSIPIEPDFIPTSFSVIAGGLPEGVSLDGDTGRISGIPASGGNFSFTIEIRDDIGNILNLNGEINILGESLSFMGSIPDTAIVGEPYYTEMRAKGGVPPYTWSFYKGMLPSWIGLSNVAVANEINGILRGTPDARGVFNFDLKLNDAVGAQVIIPAHIDVELMALTIDTPKQLPEVLNGEQYDIQLEASGGKPPYTWRLKSGFMPDSLEIDASGRIFGIAEDEGNHSMRIEVEDSLGAKGRGTFYLVIGQNPVNPVTGLIACASDGKVGLAWKNPFDFRFRGVRLLRKTGAYSLDSDDGVIVFEGMADNIVDSSTKNGTTYYYTAFAYDNKDNFSMAVPTSRASAAPGEVRLSGTNDPFADEVVEFSPLSGGGYGCWWMPRGVLGPPSGGGIWQGSVNVVSLHAKENTDDGASEPYGGSITLKFNDNIVVNGPGVDLTIFENVFYASGNSEDRFIEPAVVSVSQDGIVFYEFPFDYIPHYDAQGNINHRNPYSYAMGFAGVNAVLSNGIFPDPTDPRFSGGDSFDLSDLPGVNLSWVRYVRITSTGDNWLTDINGDKVRHIKETSACNGSGKSGFDLDAVSAVHY